MHSAGLYGPAGLLSPWTVRPLDVRNTLGAALSSARTALTRMFFDARTVHQVDGAPREARRSLPRPPSSASAYCGTGSRGPLTHDPRSYATTWFAACSNDAL